MADDDNTRPVDQDASTADLGKPSSAALPKKIGPYRILEQIGEGGMGIVYLAEQTEPVQRRVALKVIKLGMDTKQVIARFEAERQALAMMDHPCVARVFDAGATDDGRPYFVMEHVPGVPITDHCDRQRLNIAERLDLFMRVCEAVQHAHQKGIIHRDIKPNNILVSVRDGEAVPKVIDFGVAKAIHQKLTEKTLFTEQGQLVGTPEYMSPEQAEMTAQDIDTRSDIYSLGVLLYELLTGALPFDPKSLRQAAFAEIQRIIREQEPPRPSTRLSSLGDASSASASARRIDPRSLERELRGDLDWIVMKALEKDRTRRYDTATSLAEDIRRHLSHEPVLAGPPSAAYRVGKFIRRNRTGVVAAGIVLVVLLAGIVGTSWGLVQATAARAEETKRAEELEQVAEFQASQLSGIDVPLMATRLRADVFAEARNAWEAAKVDASEIEKRAARLETLLAGTNFTDVALHTLDENVFEGALVAVDEKFADQPLVRARLLQTVAETLTELGLLDRATRPQTDALAIRRRVLGDEHPDTLGSISNMGRLLQDRGKLEEAEPYYQEALAVRRRVLGDEHPDTLGAISSMGLLLQDRGKFDEAEPYLQEALSGYRRVLGDEHPYTLASIDNMGGLLHGQGKLDEAEPHFQESLEGRRRNLGDEHPATLASINNMGVLLQSQGKLDEAEPYFQEALAGCRRLLGDEHPDTLISINNMGALLESQGKLYEAAAYYQEALEGYRRLLGDEHSYTLGAIILMGNLLHRQGKFDEAEPYYQEVLAGRRRRLGDEHPDTLTSINNMGWLLNAQRRYAVSESILRESLETGKNVLGADHWRVAEARSLLGESVAGQKRLDEAEPLLLEGYTGLESSLPSGRRAQKLPPAIERLIKLYDAWGKPDKADEWRAMLPPPDEEEETSPKTERESDADKDN